MKQDLMRNRKLFASLVNNISKAGERKIKAEELTLEDEDVLDCDAVRKLLPNYAGCTMMHSPTGDYKLIQLGDGR